MKKSERGSGSVGGAMNSCSRLFIVGLLVVIGVLAFNYWSVITAHRATNEKLTKLSATYDELSTAKAEGLKKLDVCSEQLKSASDEVRRLKEAFEVKQKNMDELQAELTKTKDSVSRAVEDKTAAEKRVEAEKTACQDSLAKKEETCEKSCDDRLTAAKQTAESSCQQQLQQQRQQAQQHLQEQQQHRDNDGQPAAAAAHAPD
jgi:chromosome segregation ATPase